MQGCTIACFLKCKKRMCIGGEEIEMPRALYYVYWQYCWLELRFEMVTSFEWNQSQGGPPPHWGVVVYLIFIQCCTYVDMFVAFSHFVVDLFVVA